MSPDPEAPPAPGEVPRWLPRPEPTDAELRRYERRHQLLAPLRLAGRVASFLRAGADPPGEIRRRLRALQGMALWKLWPASETPLNGPVGPHRIFDWTTLSLEEAKQMRRAAGCKLNDVILAVVCGAIRDFMRRRGVRLEKLDFRTSTPVDVRRESERGRISGNRVSSWLIRLPLAEPDPLARLAAIQRETQARKDSNDAIAIEIVNALHEVLPIDLQGLARGTMNTIVTNVPGPASPLYLVGAELLAVYPQPPLLEDLGLVTGVVSYAGRLCVGVNADYDRVPDLDAFVAAVERAFAELAEALGVSWSVPIRVTSAASPAIRPAEPERPRRRARARAGERETPASTH
jgi:WS/DGAT/MGAT family acyltransferase